MTKFREQNNSINFKQHEFIAAKRETTIYGKSDTILSRKKKLVLMHLLYRAIFK